MNAAVCTLLMRAVRNAGLPGIFNLFLFGLRDMGTSDGVSGHRASADRSAADPGPGCRCRGIDYDEIHLKVNDWAEHRAAAGPDFTLGNIAEDIGVPKRALSRYFEDWLKVDFRLWRNRIRIASAQRMLLVDDVDMGEMAMRLGFKDKSNFHRQFKALVGCTPGRWKNSGGHPELDGGALTDSSKQLLKSGID